MHKSINGNNIIYYFIVECKNHQDDTDIFWWFNSFLCIAYIQNLATYWFLQNPNRPTMQSRFFKIVVVETELWFLLLPPLLLERDTFSPFENAGDCTIHVHYYIEMILNKRFNGEWVHKHCTTYVMLKIMHQENISTFLQDDAAIVRQQTKTYSTNRIFILLDIMFMECGTFALLQVVSPFPISFLRLCALSLSTIVP